MKLLVLIVMILSCSTVVAQDGLTLTVKVVGAKPNTGNAIVSLFTKENYLKDPTTDRTIPINAVGSAEAQLKNLAPGMYAVSVVYDENRDGKLNTGLFGMPIEKVGMSNNAKGRFGPPSFEKAAFDFSDSRVLEILLAKAKK